MPLTGVERMVEKPRRKVWATDQPLRAWRMRAALGMGWRTGTGMGSSAASPMAMRRCASFQASLFEICQAGDSIEVAIRCTHCKSLTFRATARCSSPILNTMIDGAPSFGDREAESEEL